MRSECCCCRAVFAPRGTNDPWGGRLAAFCEDCALTRCDAFPGACRDGHGTPEALAPTPVSGSITGSSVGVLPSEATERDTLADRLRARSIVLGVEGMTDDERMDAHLMGEAAVALAAMSSPVHHRERRLDAIRAEWVKDGVLCHFCGGPAFAWLTDDETWAQTESLLGSGQACAVCFLAARQVLGLSTGVPVRIVVSSPVQATGREERVAEALVRYDGVLAQAQAELVKRSDDDFYWEDRVRDFVNVVRDLRKRHRRVLAFARTAAPSPDSGSSLAAVSVPPEAAECEDVSDLAESAQWALLEMRDRFSLERGQSVSLDALEDALRKSEGAGEEAGTETRPSQEGFGLHQPHPVQEKPGTGLPLSACHFGGDVLCEKPCAQHGECVHPDRARTSSAVPPETPKGEQSEGGS